MMANTVIAAEHGVPVSGGTPWLFGFLLVFGGSLVIIVLSIILHSWLDYHGHNRFGPLVWVGCTIMIAGVFTALSFTYRDPDIDDHVADKVESHYHVVVIDYTSKKQPDTRSVTFTDRGYQLHSGRIVVDRDGESAHARLMVNKDSHLVEYSP